MFANKFFQLRVSGWSNVDIIDLGQNIGNQMVFGCDNWKNISNFQLCVCGVTLHYLVTSIIFVKFKWKMSSSEHYTSEIGMSSGLHRCTYHTWFAPCQKENQMKRNLIIHAISSVSIMVFVFSHLNKNKFLNHHKTVTKN